MQWLEMPGFRDMVGLCGKEVLSMCMLQKYNLVLLKPVVGFLFRLLTYCSFVTNCSFKSQLSSTVQCIGSTRAALKEKNNCKKQN